MNAKTTFRLLARISAIVFLAFLATSIISAQDVILPDPPDKDTTVLEFANWTNLVYAALLTILGYISSYIPGLNKISDKAWRVLAIGLVLAGIFLINGFSSGLGLAFSYLSAVGAYDLVFSKIKKTPDPRAVGGVAMTATRNTAPPTQN